MTKRLDQMLADVRARRETAGREKGLQLRRTGQFRESKRDRQLLIDPGFEDLL